MSGGSGNPKVSAALPGDRRSLARDLLMNCEKHFRGHVEMDHWRSDGPRYKILNSPRFVRRVGEVVKFTPLSEAKGADDIELTPEQTLRRELLLRTLQSGKDPDSALSLAAKLERFIIGGSEALATAAGGGAEFISAHALPSSSQTSLQAFVKTGVTESGVGQATNPPRVSDATARRRWTDDEEAALRELWTQGHSAKEIATQLKRTTTGVRVRAHHLGLSARRQGKPDESSA